MASNIKISTAARNAMIDAFTALIDGGTGAGRIEIRVGAPPTNVSDASSGTLLASCAFNTDSYAAGSTGTAVMNESPAVQDTSADGSGDAGYFRIYPGAAADTAALLQGTAGNAGDTPDLTFDNKTIAATGTVVITSLDLVMPIQ